MLVKIISDTSGLVVTSVLNTKISEVENEIPDNSKYNLKISKYNLTTQNLIN